MLKLNMLSNDVFDASNAVDTKVTVGGKTISRNDIVSTGRLLACEYAGKNIFLGKSAEKYQSRCDSHDLDYATLSKDHQRSKFLFCAAVANQMNGKPAPASFEEAEKENYRQNAYFWNAYNAIDVDVLTPVFATIFEDVAMGGLADVRRIPLGRTYQIDIASNDVFLFEDNSWGSGRSTTKNYLYGNTVTLTPKMYSCNATIKWYQDVVQGDAGRYYAAIMGGMWNKIYAIFMQTLITAAGDTKYVPSGLIAQTYNSQNWLNITTLVAAANGVRRDNLFAFGQATALAQVLPQDGTTGAMLGLQYGLGEEWFRRGFLPNAAGVQLVEVMPVIVPGTQNSTLDTISLGNNIYVAAKGGYGYAPLVIGIGEGSPITMTATPRETADFTIDINVGAYFDIKPVFASKIGVIQYSA